MKNEEKCGENCCKDVCTKGKNCHSGHGGSGNAIYGLGVIGALVYFLQGANSFSLVMTGIGKAIFWPALLIFRVLTDLKM